MAMAIILLLGACLAHQAFSLKTVASNHTEVKAPKSIILGSIEHHLLICNAYASNKSLAVYRVQESRYLTGDVPLAYKDCRSYPLHLVEGEGFEFYQGDLKVGVFATTGLPQTSTTLLLVPMRRTLLRRSAKFMSHAFLENKAAQVVVVDTFGTGGDAGKHGAVKIVDRGGDGKEENLRFGSVVPLPPGKYGLALDGGSLPSKVEVPMQTVESSKHVVMRVGMDAGGNKNVVSYPQELVVFPQVATAVQESAASRSGELASAAVAVLLAVAFMATF